MKPDQKKSESGVGQKAGPSEKNKDEIFGFLSDQVKITGDVMNTVPAEEWESGTLGDWLEE